MGFITDKASTFPWSKDSCCDQRGYQFGLFSSKDTYTLHKYYYSPWFMCTVCAHVHAFVFRGSLTKGWGAMKLKCATKSTDFASLNTCSMLLIVISSLNVGNFSFFLFLIHYLKENGFPFFTNKWNKDFFVVFLRFFFIAFLNYKEFLAILSFWVFSQKKKCC
jgi:hypothetical protein